MPTPEGGAALVIDASVLINLLGCGAAEEILQSLPNRVFIEPRALSEVLRAPSRNLPARAQRALLVEPGQLHLRALTGEAIASFLDLAAEPDGLDDGEAATIACAIELGAGVVLDERKARRIVRERFQQLGLRSTAGLFQALLEPRRKAAERVRTHLLAALQRARMSVPAEETNWVIDQLGVEVARQCPSIRRSAIQRFLR